MKVDLTRRHFLGAAGLGGAALAAGGRAIFAAEDGQLIQGFERSAATVDASEGWQPVSDRKLRVGIAGYGLCKFGADFGFQDHPNVEMAAVSDLFPDRRDGLAEACRCSKTYDSLEEMVQDDSIEAIFCATDAPSHARHCIEAMKHGKHVATCVPAVWGSLEEADELLETVRSTGLKYMMFETSCFHEDLHAMRQIYRAGLFGKLIYTEGEYYHYQREPYDSYKDWRIGKPPLWYPTHSTAYYVGVTGGSFTDVSCLGMPGIYDYLRPENNAYANPHATEVALLRTTEGGMARMTVSTDTPSEDFAGVMGRVRGQQAAFDRQFDPAPGAALVELPNLRRPPLPPGVEPGGHGGSHGHLMNEFVLAILTDRPPLVDVVPALNMTVAGVVAHASAMKDGETMKIPQYRL